MAVELSRHHVWRRLIICEASLNEAGVESFHFLAYCGRAGEHIFQDTPNAEAAIITISRVRIPEKRQKLQVEHGIGRIPGL